MLIHFYIYVEESLNFFLVEEYFKNSLAYFLPQEVNKLQLLYSTTSSISYKKKGMNPIFDSINEA